MLFLRTISHGEECSRWHGLCWRDFIRDKYIVAPIPLNLIYRIIYAFWLFLVHPFRCLSVLAGKVKRWTQEVDDWKLKNEELHWQIFDLKNQLDEALRYAESETDRATLERQYSLCDRH